MNRKTKRLLFFVCIIIAMISSGCVNRDNQNVSNTEVGIEVGSAEADNTQAGNEGLLTITDDKAYREMAWNYTVESDISFGSNGMKLDVYRTDKEGVNPAIILLHGGGFTAGDKANAGLLKSLAIDYAKMGYVVIVPNYRLGTSVSYTVLMNAMSDAKDAYDWVIENGAEYGVDTNYVAIGGYSAGAITAINLCYTKQFDDLDYERLFCVIDISGGSLYYSMTDADAPGCVIVHGTNDTTVKYSESVKFSEDLEAKGIDVKMNSMEGLNHDLLSRYDDVRNNIAEYMYKCLSGQEVDISIEAEISPEYQKVLNRMDNGMSYDVEQLEVELDGSLDEWEGFDEIRLDKLKDVGTSLPEEADFTGSVMLAWNEVSPTTLYIAAKVRDDDIKNTVPLDGQWYLDDCLEIVFDMSDNQKVQQLTKWVIGAGDNDLSVLASPDNTTVVMTKNGDEYIFEIAINIEKVPAGTYLGEVELDFAPEKSIGFSISYNDGENGERQHQVGWTAGKSSDRSTLGTLYFK